MNAGEVGESAELSEFREAHGAQVELFNRGEFAGAFSMVREDHEYHSPQHFLQPPVRGRQALIETFEDFTENMTGWTMEPQEYVQAGPSVFVVGSHYRGAGSSSGIPTEAMVWDVYELDEDGKIERTRQFTDRDEALASAVAEAEART